MNSLANLLQRAIPLPPLSMGPVNSASLRDQAYALLKKALEELDIYDPRQGVRLDERQLSAALGISRTPVREALSRLEHEGFIQTRPRRGIYIVRKSKREIIEMIQMWAALESMAARLATLHAPDTDIAELRRRFAASAGGHWDANIAFHIAVIALGESQILIDGVRNLIAHVSAARRAVVLRFPAAKPHDNVNFAAQVDIIEALEARDTELAERLTREYTLGITQLIDVDSDRPA